MKLTDTQKQTRIELAQMLQTMATTPNWHLAMADILAETVGGWDTWNGNCQTKIQNQIATFQLMDTLQATEQIENGTWIGEVSK